MTTRKTTDDVPTDENVPMPGLEPDLAPAPEPKDAAPGPRPKPGRKSPFHRHDPEPAPAAKRGPGRPPKATGLAQLRKELQDTIDKVTAGLAIVSLVSPKLAYDCAIIGANSEALSKELVRLAESSPWLERALRSIVSVRDTGQVLVLVTTIALPIAANHGLLGAAGADLAVMVGAPRPPDAGSAGLSDVINLFGAGQADPTP